MFEPAENRDAACAAERPDYAAIQGTKQPTNTGRAGCFPQSFQVEPAETDPPLKRTVALVFAGHRKPRPCDHPCSQLHMAP